MKMNYNSGKLTNRNNTMEGLFRRARAIRGLLKEANNAQDKRILRQMLTETYESLARGNYYRNIEYR